MKGLGYNWLTMREYFKMESPGGNVKAASNVAAVIWNERREEARDGWKVCSKRWVALVSFGNAKNGGKKLGGKCYNVSLHCMYVSIVWKVFNNVRNYGGPPSNNYNQITTLIYEVPLKSKSGLFLVSLQRSINLPMFQMESIYVILHWYHMGITTVIKGSEIHFYLKLVSQWGDAVKIQLNGMWMLWRIFKALTACSIMDPVHWYTFQNVPKSMTPFYYLIQWKTYKKWMATRAQGENDPMTIKRFSCTTIIGLPAMRIFLIFCRLLEISTE